MPNPVRLISEELNFTSFLVLQASIHIHSFHNPAFLSATEISKCDLKENVSNYQNLQRDKLIHYHIKILRDNSDVMEHNVKIWTDVH